MDILAHTLWAGAGTAVLARRRPLEPRIVAATIAAACLPDAFQMLPLLGWWSHTLIDVFTHSAEYYASPVLYPFTQRGFDGVPWNAPWFMVLNYLALLAVYAALWASGRQR